MEEQEWRTHARRHAPLRTNQAANGALSPRAVSANQRLPNHTIASANKSVGRKNEPRENGLPAGPSRWKEMRQAVRIKATIDTDVRRTANAKIADLCDEDRDKVAKLVRRIVDVSALHEQSEQEFQRQRSVMESEIQELRGHVKRDTREIVELSDKLKDALGKLRDYQERVLVLEESNELEVCHRLETDQTVDLLKLEVDKLRKLVKRQRQEMDAKESGQQRIHKEEMEHMAQQLQASHEQLLQERRERLDEKQRDLEDRIQRTAAAAPATTVAESVQASTANKYDSPAVKSNGGKERVSLPIDFSFLNTSVELPDKIKEIMNEWKVRMEDALNMTAASTAREDAVPSPRRVVSTGIQTEVDKEVRPSENSHRITPTRREVTRSKPTQREAFDRMLVGEPPSRPRHHDNPRRSVQERSVSPGSRSSSSPREIAAHSPHVRELRDGHPAHKAPSVTRVVLDDFANASVLVDDESFEDEVESTIALIDGFQSPPPHHTPALERTRTPRRKLSLYDSPMLDVVDAIENDASTSSERSRRVPSPRSQVYYAEEESPTVRVERLLEGLKIREQKLARVGSCHSPSSADEPSFLRDVVLFNEVKDVYTQHLHETRHDGLQSNHSDDVEPYDDEEDDYDDVSDVCDPLSSSHSSRGLSVQEAIEKDMHELLQQEGFPLRTRGHFG